MEGGPNPTLNLRRLMGCGSIPTTDSGTTNGCPKCQHAMLRVSESGALRPYSTRKVARTLSCVFHCATVAQQFLGGAQQSCNARGLQVSLVVNTASINTHNPSTASSRHSICSQATSRALAQGMPNTITICGSINSCIMAGSRGCACVCSCMLVCVLVLLYTPRQFLFSHSTGRMLRHTCF